MRSISASVVLILSIVLGGCASVAHGPSFSESRPSSPGAGKAIVYVFRKYAEPTAWGTTIYFDEKEIATLNQGGFTWAYLALGKHTIRGVWAGLSGQVDSFIDLDVKAETTYYVEVTGTTELVGMTPDASSLIFRVGSGLNEISAVAAEDIVSQCCKFQKTR